MKELKIRLVFFLLAILFIPELSYSSGIPMAESWSFRLDGFRIVNFAILLILIVLLVRPAISRLLFNRREQIENRVEKLVKEQDEINDRLAGLESSIKMFEKNAQKAKEEAGEYSNQLRDDLLKEAKRESESILLRFKDDMETIVDMERALLLKKTLRKAVDEAKTIIENKIDNDKQRDLLKIYMQDIDN